MAFWPDGTALLGPMVWPSRAANPNVGSSGCRWRVRPAAPGCPRNPGHPLVNKFPRVCPRFLSPPRTLFASASTDTEYSLPLPARTARTPPPPPAPEYFFSLPAQTDPFRDDAAPSVRVCPSGWARPRAQRGQCRQAQKPNPNVKGSPTTATLYSFYTVILLYAILSPKRIYKCVRTSLSFSLGPGCGPFLFFHLLHRQKVEPKPAR